MINNNFAIKHAETLLMYQSYLLYDIQIKLESAEAYKAINSFIKSVKNKISHKFFRMVEAHVDIDWLDHYNQFVKLYLNKDFKANKIDIILNDSISEYDAAEKSNKELTLEYYKYAMCPNYSKFQCKIISTLYPDEEA